MPYSSLSEQATVKTFAEKMKLKNLTPEIDLESRKLNTYSTNRPALQLTGFFESFDLGPMERIQVIGRLEQAYINSLDVETIYKRFEEIASYKVPCFVFTRGYRPCSWIMKACLEHGVPVFSSERSTSELISETLRWLKVIMAPKETVHGVLIDVYGEGVLIQGDSGIGKSEAALELIKRGHRLVSDDAVEIRKVSDDTLVGLAPELTKDFIELRGIGVINVRAMFGFEAVKQTQNIDMVVKLAEFDPEKKYDRMGMEDNYTEILGNKVISYDIPISPGRNIAVIVECAAVNNRAKKMGYNAPKEFMDRVKKEMERESKET